MGSDNTPRERVIATMREHMPADLVDACVETLEDPLRGLVQEARSEERKAIAVALETYREDAWNGSSRRPSNFGRASEFVRRGWNRTDRDGVIAAREHIRAEAPTPKPSAEQAILDAFGIDKGRMLGISRDGLTFETVGPAGSHGTLSITLVGRATREEVRDALAASNPTISGGQGYLP